MKNSLNVAVSTLPGVDGAARVADVSWPVILAGAVASAALSLSLLVLGVGLGLSTISPWTENGVNAQALRISSVVWLLVTQIAAASLGGYLAGRLRAHFVTQSDQESDIRDAVHGFLVWAVATLLVAVLAGTVVGATVSTGISVSAGLAGNADNASRGVAINDRHAGSVTVGDLDQYNESANDDEMLYIVDSLFRTEQPALAADTARDPERAIRIEVRRIFINGMRFNEIPESDRIYLAKLVANRINVSLEEADKRVDEAFTAAQTAMANHKAILRESAEQARKTLADTSLWIFFALVVGAGAGSCMATIGGRNRARRTTRNEFESSQII